MKRMIKIVWTIEDVLSLNESLTKKEASEVLVALERDFDASIGINWDVIEAKIDELVERKKGRI